MADAKPAENTAEAPPKKKSKLLLIIAILLALILIGGAAAVFMLLSHNNADEEGDAEEEEVVEVEEPKKKKKKDPAAPPVYVALDTFTVNLMPVDDLGDQYLQVVMSLELEDSAEEANLKARMPKIRNDITLLLSSQTAPDLQTAEGKLKLATDLKDKINFVLNPPTITRKGEVPKTPEGPVTEVLFTSFIVQ